MAWEYYDPNSGYKPEWADAWTPQALPSLLQAVGVSASRGLSSLGEMSDNQRQQFYQALAQRGWKLGLDSDGQYGKYQVFDQNGNPVGDAASFNSGGLLDLAAPLIVGAGFAGLTGALGGAASGGAGAGGLTGEGAAAASTTGGGLGSTGVAGAGGAGVTGTLPTVVVSGTSSGGLGSLGIGGIGAAGSAGAGVLGGLSSADKAALYGDAGYGAGMSGAQTSIYDGILNATGSTSLANMAANSGLGSWLSNGAQALGGWGNVASLVGGVLGGASGGGTTSSVANQIDPRMAAYLYGSGYGDTNSLLGAAQQLYGQNKSGLNSTMQQGLAMQKNALNDPAYGQTYTQMRSLGNGLLSAGVAGNPFTGGQATVPQGADPKATTGLLSVSDLMNRGKGLLVM